MQELNAERREGGEGRDKQNMCKGLVWYTETELKKLEWAEG